MESCDKHGGNIPELVMNVMGTFHDDAMLRQVTESVMITLRKPSLFIIYLLAI